MSRTGKPDQYLATKMIAMMMNAAIIESARSSDFDRALAPSSGGMRLTQTQKNLHRTSGVGRRVEKVGAVSFGAMPMATRLQSSDVAASCLVKKRQ
jgi:hypothetical protein